jgi:hypothetical protein
LIGPEKNCFERGGGSGSLNGSAICAEIAGGAASEALCPFFKVRLMEITEPFSA